MVEQAHRRTKSMLARMLVLRRSRDFPNVGAYQRWVPRGFFFLFAPVAFATNLRWRSGNQEFGVGHPHHLLGNGVGLPLQRPVDRADR